MMNEDVRDSWVDGDLGDAWLVLNSGDVCTSTVRRGDVEDALPDLGDAWLTLDGMDVGDTSPALLNGEVVRSTSPGLLKGDAGVGITSPVLSAETGEAPRGTRPLA